MFIKFFKQILPYFKRWYILVVSLLYNQFIIKHYSYYYLKIKLINKETEDIL